MTYGWEMEADLRHDELVVEQRGLSYVKAVSTPGVGVAARSAAGGKDENQRKAYK